MMSWCRLSPAVSTIRMPPTALSLTAFRARSRRPKRSIRNSPARGIKLDAVLELEVDEDALLDRIRGRAEEAANKGEPVRRDDNPEVFKTRLDVYREQTAPVTEYYRSQGLLNIVDGLQPIDAVTEQLTAALAALPSHQIRSDVR